MRLNFLLTPLAATLLLGLPLAAQDTRTVTEPHQPSECSILKAEIVSSHGVITPAGWREWHPGETHSLDTAYYAEFDSTGPGAHPTERDPHTHFLTPRQPRSLHLRSFFAAATTGIRSFFPNRRNRIVRAA